MDSPRYTFGPLDRRGVILGLRSGQLAVAVCGFLLALSCFMTLPSGPASLFVAMATLALTAAAVVLPVAGRGGDEWLPVVLRWFVARPQRWASPAPARGQRVRVRDGVVVTMADQQAWPPTLKGVALLAGTVRSGELGVVRDRARDTYTGLLRVRGSSYALLSDDEKARRLAAWGATLASFAHHGTPVAAVQLVVRSVSEDATALTTELETERTVAADHPTAESYRNLIAHAAPVTQSQEVVIALAISRRRSSRAIALAGGGDRGAVTVLERQLHALQEQLERADVAVDGALSPRLLAQRLRETWDPGVGHREGGEGVALGAAGPQATRATWRSYVTDGDTHHATYWVSEWPRVDVGPNFMVPLLLQTAATMTFSLTASPVDPLRAARDLDVAQTAHISDEMLRDKHGFRTSVRHRREAAAVSRRERELADGHAEYRFTGHITVTAPTAQALEAACGEVEQQARASRLDVRRMDGDHDLGFVSTLPVCRGLR